MEQTTPLSSLYELQARRSLCLLALRIVDRAVGDPRREEALAEYNRQLAEIDRRIAGIIGTPPPVVIGLKAANLFGKTC